jgi:cell division protein FtsZ
MQVESIIENNQENDYEQSFTEEVLNDTNVSEDINSAETEHSISNGLENFGVEEKSGLDLFSSDNESEEPNDLLSPETNEDEDLEIPAFLRRQKN